MVSLSWSSSVEVPSKVAGNRSPGLKEGRAISDSATLMRIGFTTVRLLSRRQIKSFSIPRGQSPISSCKENSGLFLLKLFSALLSLTNGPSWPRRSEAGGEVAGLFLEDTRDEEGVRAECSIYRSTELGICGPVYSLAISPSKLGGWEQRRT